MSIKVRDFLSEYVKTCIDFYIGKGRFETLPENQKNNIGHYVELKLYNKLRPAGAAPILNAESPSCEGLLELLKQIEFNSKDEMAKHVIDAIEAYLSDLKKTGKDLGDFVTFADIIANVKEKQKEEEKKKKVLIEVTH